MFGKLATDWPLFITILAPLIVKFRKYKTMFALFTHLNVLSTEEEEIVSPYNKQCENNNVAGFKL